MRLSRVGKIGFIDEPLMLVYNSPDGISKSSTASAFSTLVIFNKIKRVAPSALALMPHAVSVHRHLILKKKPASARRFLRKALQLSPWAWRLYVRYALTYVPSLYRALIRQQRRRVMSTTGET